jgi:hypothetical protein
MPPQDQLQLEINGLCPEQALAISSNTGLQATAYAATMNHIDRWSTHE